MAVNEPVGYSARTTFSFSYMLFAQTARRSGEIS